MKPTCRERQLNTADHAFTRLEAVALIAALALLAAVALPVLAGPRERSQRAQCANNLRRIFAATELWGNDHKDMVPWEVPLAEGGTKLHSLASNPWFHFSWMSNELATPVVLLCPSDTGKPAQDFSGDPAKGYLHPNFANRATSYFLSHSRAGLAEGIVAGDRNFRPDTQVASCAYFTATLAVITWPPSPSLGWTTNLHDRAGNLLQLNGAVGQYSNNELARFFAASPPDDNGRTHFIAPR